MQIYDVQKNILEIIFTHDPLMGISELLICPTLKLTILSISSDAQNFS